MAQNCSSCNTAIPAEAKFCPVCGTRVAPAPTPAPAPAEPAPAATQVDAPRALAGRFLISGAGVDSPVGTVFAATDLQNGEAPVRVLLVADAVLPSPPLVDRTLREWKQLAKVTTPHLVKIIDQGRLDDGKVYVATEPPRGISLAALVAKEGPLSIERARKIVSQIGEALGEAQKVGVIHRDVAPGNVYVDGDHVGVLDFGVAQAVNDKVFGSPAYLSPEQAEGKPVDQRSNIYSLGAMLYFMFTGRAPFDGDVPSLLSQHTSATPAAPSSRRPGLPAEIDRIVLKALEKSGGRRHLTLRQLVTEMEAAGQGEDPARAKTLQPAVADVKPVSPAATVLGMPAPVIAKAVEGARTVMAEAPAVAPKAPAPEAAAKTLMAEAPAVAAKAAVPQAAAAKTMMAEAPAVTVKTAAPEASAKTMMAEAPVAIAPTPAAAPALAATTAVKAAAPPKKGGFRETAWFKQGEIDEQLAKAEAEASSIDPLAPTGRTGQHAVATDGSDLSKDDAKRLSLKTGATQMMQAVKTGASPALPGDRMDEEDMLAEIDRSKRMFTIAGVIVGVAVLGIVILLATRKPEAPPAPKPAPVEPKAAAPVPPPQPAPSPAPVAPKGPAPDSFAALIAEAETAAGKQDWIVAVDALLRASHAEGADAAKVSALTASVSKSLNQSAVMAKKKHDRAGESEAKALLAKLKPLAPAAAAPTAHAKAGRKR